MIYDQANEEKRKINSLVSTSANAAKPKKLKMPIYSNPFEVEVVDYPIKLQYSTEKFKVAVGQKVEFNATIEKDFGFDDEVSFSSTNSSGLNVRLVDNNKISKGQTQGKLIFEANENQKPGTYSVTLTASYRFNNQPIKMVQELEFVVE